MKWFSNGLGRKKLARVATERRRISGSSSSAQSEREEAPAPGAAVACWRLDGCKIACADHSGTSPIDRADHSGTPPTEYSAGKFGSRIFNRGRPRLNLPVGKSSRSRLPGLNIRAGKNQAIIFRPGSRLLGDFPTGRFNRACPRLNIRLPNFPTEYSVGGAPD